ncbi:MAG: hypothetical protein IIB99_00370 [Planctomycetes bacterium]|nr:hypothetical protein [Planctomycetota bacterium]MCH8209802.1 hypothetical protein [Planctomycetota bacterium]MCH8259882.1 hypothetical protein [Planctomycetota bacterium]
MMQNLHFTRPLLLSTVGLVVAGIVLVTPLPGLLAAMFTTSIGQDSAGENMQAYLAAHDRDLATYRERFEGRSLFFRPPAPAVKPAPKPRSENKPEAPPPPPPIPMSYGGPVVIAVIGDQVWFKSKDNLRLRVGEEGAGVKVLASNPPWTVKLGYAGGEYDVPVFKNYQTEFSSSPLTERPTPGIVFANTADRPVKAPGQVGRQPSDDG